MANLSNINNVLRVSSNLRVGINTDAASYALEIGGTNSGIKLKNSATDGRVYSLLSDTSGNFQIYDDAAASGRLVIASGGAATFAGTVKTKNTNASAYPYFAIEASAKEYHIGVGGASAVTGYANNLYFYDNTAAAIRMVLDTSGNVGIGDDTPTSKLTILGTSTAASNTLSDAIFDIQGTSTAHLLIGVAAVSPFGAWINTDSTAQPLVLMGTGGNVGIGTDIPGTKLSIASGVAKTSTSTPEVLYLGQSNEASNYSTLQVYTKGGASQADRKVIFQTIETGVANAGSIILQPSGGDVGIGTTSPSDYYADKLVVKLDSSENGITIVANSNTDNNYIMFADGTTGNDRFRGQIAYNHQTNFMAFAVNASNKMYIKSEGNVGIGTDSPNNFTNQTSLTVSGTSIGRVDVQVTAGGGGGIYGSSSQMKMFSNYGMNLALESGSGGGITTFATNATERMRITSGGNINIGSGGLTQVSYQLRVDSDFDNGIYLSAGSSSSNHAFYVENHNSSAEYFAVRGDGEIRLNASSGHTYAAKGIRFGANASSNNLDYYEEGTWTPTIKDLSGNLATLSAASGTYTKIGRQVFLNYRVQLSSRASMTGSYVLLGGLPFNHPTGTNGSGTIDYFQNMATGFSSLAWDTTSTGSVCWMVGVLGTSSTGSVYVTPAQITDTTVLKGTIIYMAVT